MTLTHKRHSTASREVYDQKVLSAAPLRCVIMCVITFTWMHGCLNITCGTLCVFPFHMHERTPLSSLRGSLDRYAIHSTVCLQDSLDWGYTFGHSTCFLRVSLACVSDMSEALLPTALLLIMTLSAGTIATGTSGATLGRKYYICVTCVCVGKCSTASKQHFSWACTVHLLRQDLQDSFCLIHFSCFLLQSP